MDRATRIDSPLRRAILRNDVAEVERLITAGSNVRDIDSEGNTALDDWVRGTGTRELLAVLLKGGADINAPCTGPFSALHTAVVAMKPDKVMALLDAEAFVNVQDRATKTTPLHLAARVNNAAITKALLSAGADPRLRDAQLMRPLDCAQMSHGPAKELLRRATRGISVER